ncbi:MAG: YgcG family protein [Syntrophales bacterium]
MRSSVRILLILLSLWVIFLPPPARGAEKFPAPTGAVNDFAGVIPPPYREKMENLAQEVLRKTGTSIVVAAFPAIGDAFPEEFANRLYQAWGIGGKGEDKGVLIFLSVKERKIRIETGYGVEGILPDGLVGEILDRDVVPYLKKGDYGAGLYNAMADVSSVVARDANVTLRGRPESARQPPQYYLPLHGNIWTWILLGLIISLLLGTRTGRWILLYMFLSGGHGGGTGFGGFGGGGFGGFGGGSSGGAGAGRDF